MENILITSEGIQKNLRHIKPTKAVCEYIWNGFDASASRIDISFSKNKLDMIDTLTISDNGNGINFEELKQKFQPYNDSEKFRERQKTSHHSLPHGRNGVGRLTFFVFAETAVWHTVYKKDNNTNASYSITMYRQTLNSYDPNNNETPMNTQSPLGTKVTFSSVTGIYEDELLQAIKNEFFWFIELNNEKNYKIFLNGNELDFKSVVIEEKLVDISELELDHQYTIKIYQWKESLGKEFSKYYFLNSKDNEVYKDNTTLNKKSDNFFHSVYIKSDYFDDFLFDDENTEQIGLMPTKSNAEYKKVIQYINNILLKLRKEYLKKDSTKFINNLIDKNVYPEFKDTNIIDTYRKQQLNEIVETLYTAEPKIFTGMNTEQQKIFIRLLNMIMDSDEKDSFFNIIKEVIELDDTEVKELSEVLQFTALNHITKTVKLIEDRVKVVQQLKELVFEKKFNAKEVPHIQRIVENHYWLFGEKYNLVTAAEPDFNQALMRKIYAETGKMEKVSIEHEDVNKEMDIYMLRQNKEQDFIENVVVELKRPTVPLGEEQLSQVKKYMRVIQSESRFNSSNSKWTYYLIGNRLNNNGYMQGEINSHKNLGEKFLVHADGNQKIYVMTWSEVFEQFTIKHDYLLEKLKLSKELWLKEHENVDDIIKDSENSAQLPSLSIPDNSGQTI